MLCLFNPLVCQVGERGTPSTSSPFLIRFLLSRFPQQLPHSVLVAPHPPDDDVNRRRPQFFSYPPPAIRIGERISERPYQPVVAPIPHLYDVHRPQHQFVVYISRFLPQGTFISFSSLAPAVLVPNLHLPSMSFIDTYSISLPYLWSLTFSCVYATRCLQVTLSFFPATSLFAGSVTGSSPVHQCRTPVIWC